MKAKDIIDEVNTLPVAERAKIVDIILTGLNAIDPELEKEWIKIANKRYSELRSGAVKPISGEEVFRKIRKRFSK